MLRVDFTGMSNECFAEMVEQILLALNNFASHGNGWNVDQINNVDYDLLEQDPLVVPRIWHYHLNWQETDTFSTSETNRTRNVFSIATLPSITLRLALQSFHRMHLGVKGPTHKCIVQKTHRQNNQWESSRCQWAFIKCTDLRNSTMFESRCSKVFDKPDCFKSTHPLSP